MVFFPSQSPVQSIHRQPKSMILSLRAPDIITEVDLRIDPFLKDPIQHVFHTSGMRTPRRLTCIAGLRYIVRDTCLT